MARTGSRRVSIEVSNSAVRIAEMSLSGSRAKLVNLGQVRLPARSVVDGTVVDVSAVTAAIERCVKEGGFSVREVHLGVSGLRAITRELDMPPVPDSELDSAVRLQALDVIPFPVEKTLLSARPLEDVTAPDGTPLRRVILAAAHRDLVDPLLEAVTAAGLMPVSVDLGSSALVRALYDPTLPAVGPEAIVSIGSGLTTIVVHEEGVPHFVRTIAEGGDAVTAAIAGALDLPIDDAESAKRNLDQTGPHIRAAESAANEAATSLLAEIRSSIEYYSTLSGRSEVRRVILTGGGSRLYGFAERLQQQLRAEVISGSALDRVDVSALNLAPEDVQRRDPLVATVIGLALPDAAGVKPLDLLPPEITAARRRARIERSFVIAAVVVLVALVGLGVLKYLNVRGAESTESSLKAQAANLNQEIARKSKAAHTYNEIVADEGAVAPVLENEVDWPLVLTDLKGATPKGGIVTSFSGTFVPPVAATTTTSSSSSSTGTTTTTTTLPDTSSSLAARENVVIANVNVTLSTTAGFSYFKSWLLAMDSSPQFRPVEFSGLTSANGSVTWTSELAVLGTIESGRLQKFEVTDK